MEEWGVKFGAVFLYNNGVYMTISKFIFVLCTFISGENLWHNGMTDQQKCQAEADYMARYNVRGHVFSNIGNFEGVGYGASRNAPTCQPKRFMRLTGDAVARSANGTYYRVRSWR